MTLSSLPCYCLRLLVPACGLLNLLPVNGLQCTCFGCFLGLTALRASAIAAPNLKFRVLSPQLAQISQAAGSFACVQVPRRKRRLLLDPVFSY